MSCFDTIACPNAHRKWLLSFCIVRARRRELEHDEIALDSNRLHYGGAAARCAGLQLAEVVEGGFAAPPLTTMTTKRGVNVFDSMQKCRDTRLAHAYRSWSMTLGQR